MSTRKRRKKTQAEAKTLTVPEDRITLRCSVKPKTDNQENYVKAIIENDLVFCSGPAGSGKTYLAVYFACTCLAKNLVEHIVVTRPMVACGQNLGYLPGDVKEKFDPYASPIIDAMIEFLGKECFTKLVEAGTIIIQPIELQRGKSFNKSVVLADEMQNADFKQIMMLITRHGMGTKTIVTCDPDQTDIQYDDVSWIMEELEGLPSIGVCRLENKDIQRSGLVMLILERLKKSNVYKNRIAAKKSYR